MTRFLLTIQKRVREKEEKGKEVVSFVLDYLSDTSILIF